MNKKRNLIVVGAQYSDEGKGKIVDLLAEQKNVVARYHGGPNGGHNVSIGGQRFELSCVPAGIVHGKYCVLGNGYIVSPQFFAREIKFLSEHNINLDKIMVSPKCHIIMPYHGLMSELREGKRTAKIGSTKLGIGTCQEDRVAQVGIRAQDLFLDETHLLQLISRAIREKNILLRHYFSTDILSAEEIYESIKDELEILRSFVKPDIEHFLRKQALMGEVLFEGSHGIGIDLDHGTYPYCTSCSCTSGVAFVNSGIPPTVPFRVIGCLKPYATRVGNGNLPAELDSENESCRHILNVGNEIESVTKRVQRIAWLDLDFVKNAVEINGISSLALTKVDVLSGMSHIKLIRDKNLITIPGWEAISSPKNGEGLPSGLAGLVSIIENHLGCNVSIISYGENREQSLFID